MDSILTVMERIKLTGVVPVVVIDDAKNAIPTAKALLQGGVNAMEITFRTETAADAIRAVAEAVPEMLVGAGTVLDITQCKKALENGAKFIVSPGCSEQLIDFCLENNTATVPGCVTPSEIMTAMSHGIKTVKFFPANIYGGLSGMKALAAPFGGISFLPTGGINAQNLNEYISAPFVCAVGGSWLCSKADIANGNFENISALCAQAVSIIKSVREDRS